jgi:hypothetical protein
MVCEKVVSLVGMLVSWTLGFWRFVRPSYVTPPPPPVRSALCVGLKTVRQRWNGKRIPCELL